MNALSIALGSENRKNVDTAQYLALKTTTGDVYLHHDVQHNKKGQG